MPKLWSFTALTGSASSKKSMRLSIQVHGDSLIDMGTNPLPVFYSTLETPAEVLATVTFETDQECAGREVEITYRASATYKAPVQSQTVVFLESEQLFQKKRWLMDLDRPKEGRVAKGTYTKDISVTIDPLWPSSAKTHPHYNGEGWIKYIFEAKFTKTSMGSQTPVLTESQEIWIMNSTLPSPSSSLLLSSSSPPEAAHPSFVVSDSWKKKTLPISVTLPSNSLTMAQVVPITVRMGSLTHESKYAGQEIVVMGAHFALRERVAGRANGFNDREFKGFHDVITVPLKDGWPKTAGPWERTVHLTMPTAPQVAASTKTRWMDITHSLVLVMKVKAESEKDMRATQYELEANIHIVVPRNTPESNGDVLPTYTLANSSSLDNPQNAALQYEDVKV
ncbi:hypothetical protein EDD21DRAFT_449196 [Dissophora ornata]|nr:hypothetical protein EDD21DRAFT_449196 [Dissophora ornata]